MRRSRSRSRWGRRLFALAVALAVLAALSVAALSSSDGPRHAAGVRTGAGNKIVARLPPPARPEPRSPTPMRTLTPLERRELAAIDTTLRYTPLISSGAHRRREIALTFDDGPSIYTDQILRILSRKHAPATFFIVGEQLNRFAPKLHDEIRQRVQIGDHTESHPWLLRLNGRAQTDEIGGAAIRISRGGAPFPRLFRPPYGAFNRTTLKIAHRLRMLLVLWSIDPQDWRRPGVGAIIRGVLSHASPGAIVLMHDGGGIRDQTVKALPAIIDGLRRRHFELVSVPQLVLDDPPPRNQRRSHLTGGK